MPARSSLSISSAWQASSSGKLRRLRTSDRMLQMGWRRSSTDHQLWPRYLQLSQLGHATKGARCDRGQRIRSHVQNLHATWQLGIVYPAQAIARHGAAIQ